VSETKEGAAVTGLRGDKVSTQGRAGEDVPLVAAGSQSTKRPFVSYPIFRDGRRGIDFAAVNAHVRAELRRIDLTKAAFKLATLLFDEGLLRRTLKVTFRDKANLAIHCGTNRQEIDRALDELVANGIIEVLPTNGRRIKVRLNTDSMTWRSREMVTAEEAHLARQGTAVDGDDAQLTWFDELDLNEELAGERLRDAMRRLDGEASEIPTVRPVLEPKASESPTAEGKASESPTLQPDRSDQIDSAPRKGAESKIGSSLEILEELRQWLDPKESDPKNYLPLLKPGMRPVSQWALWERQVQKHPQLVKEHMTNLKKEAVARKDAGRLLNARIQSALESAPPENQISETSPPPTAVEAKAKPTRQELAQQQYETSVHYAPPPDELGPTSPGEFLAMLAAKGAKDPTPTKQIERRRAGWAAGRWEKGE